MESLRVVLLTEGYLRGWLDFDYKTPWSRLRENIIVNATFKHVLDEVTAEELRMYNSVLGGIGTKASFELMTKQFETYKERRLPSPDKQANINKDEVTPETMTFWKKMLQAKKVEQSSDTEK